MILKKRPVFILSVADKEDGRQFFMSNFFQEVQKPLPVAVIQTLGWFIEDEQLRSLDEASADEDQSLFGKAQPSKRLVAFLGQRQPGQPMSGEFDLRIGCPGIESDGIVKSGKDHVKRRAGNSVFPVQGG